MSCDDVQLIEIAVQCESNCSSSIDDVACYAGGTHYLHGELSLDLVIESGEHLIVSVLVESS